MAAKKAKGDDWFSSLDAELEKKTREIIENVGEQNVARLELNKTLIEDFWKVWNGIGGPASTPRPSNRSSFSTDRWIRDVSGTP